MTPVPPASWPAGPTLAAVGAGVAEPARVPAARPHRRRPTAARREPRRRARARRRGAAAARRRSPARRRRPPAGPRRPRPRAPTSTSSRRGVGAAHAGARARRRDALGDLLDDDRRDRRRRSGATLGGGRRVRRVGRRSRRSPAPTTTRRSPGRPAFASAAAVHAEVEPAARRRRPRGDAIAGRARDRPARAPASAGCRRVFGPGFVAVAGVHGGDGRRPRRRRDARRRLLDGDPLAADTWALRMERVRPALARMTMAVPPGRGARHRAGARPRRHPGAARRGPTLDRADASDDGRRGRRPGVDRPARAAADVDLDGPLAGLLVDEWTEVVPSRTGDRRARLPLRPARRHGAAGDAARRAAGDRASRGRSARSTRCCSRRSTSPTCAPSGRSSLGAVGHYLPATMLAFNADGDVVSTDPNTLIG